MRIIHASDPSSMCRINNCRVYRHQTTNMGVAMQNLTSLDNLPLAPSSKLTPKASTTGMVRLAQKDHTLLTTLALLAARISPDVGHCRDELLLELSPRQRVVALLTSAILEDSRLFAPSVGNALFGGVRDGRWINVRQSTFEDKNRMIQILEAVDPRGLYWPELCGCDSFEKWRRDGDCGKIACRALAEINIEYKMKEHFVVIDSEKLFESLGRCLLVNTLTATDVTVEALYSILFSRDTVCAIADVLQTLAVAPLGDNGALGDPYDMASSVKLLIGFVSLFFGTGVVLGHQLTNHS